MLCFAYYRTAALPLSLALCASDFMKLDILKKIENDFKDSRPVLDALLSLEQINRGPVSDRIQRCIIHLSNGKLDSVYNYIDLAVRDLIWQAEYENPEIRKFDFNNSFFKLGLL